MVMSWILSTMELPETSGIIRLKSILRGLNYAADRIAVNTIDRKSVSVKLQRLMFPCKELHCLF